VAYGVDIASPEVQGYDFAQVALGATTISTMAIQVTNGGNISEYFTLSVSATHEDGWTPLPSGVPAYNQFKMLGRFVMHSAAQPQDSAFDVNHDTMTAVVPAVGAGMFGQTARTDPGVTSDLYLRLTMPLSVASPNQQSMTLIINGQAN
jgi:hypothetical protein